MLLERCRQSFDGELIPVPVESIGENFLDLRVGEREANVFAAELAVPERSCERSSNGVPGVERMAAEFNVSEAAMHWRLYNLRLVEERAARTRFSEEVRG
jgi:Zn-dependent peptidase ImmA (M78 family)